MASKSDRNDKNVFEIVFLALLAAGLFYWLSSFLRPPTVSLYLFIYDILQKFPYLFIYLPSERILFFLQQYQTVSFRPEKTSILTLMSAILPFFYPFITLILFLSWRKYTYITMTSKQTKKFDSLDKIMNLRKNTNPSAFNSYNHQKIVRDNKEYSLNGLFRQEDGPVRWCIKNHLLSFENRTLSFEKKSDDFFLNVKDQYKDYARFAGNLDIDMVRAKAIFKAQLGKSFVSVEDMSAIRIDMVNIFLLYSQEKSKRTNAKTYLNKVVSNIKISYDKKNNSGTATYTGSHKSALKKFHTLSHLVPKRSYECTHELVFVLEMLNLSRKVNADITAPDYNPLLALDRELFLLLHSYSGPNEAIENSGYIETYAPLSLWVRFDEIKSLYSMYNYQEDLIERDSEQVRLLIKLFDSKVSEISLKSINKVIKDASKAKIDINANIFSNLKNYQCPTYYSVLFALTAEYMEVCEPNIFDLQEIDVENSAMKAIFTHMEFIKRVSLYNEINPLELCSKLLNKKNVIIISNDFSNENNKDEVINISSKDLLNPLVQSSFRTVSQFSSQAKSLTLKEEHHLLASFEFTLRSCTQYLVSYLTNTEVWLKGKYNITYQSIINPAMEAEDE